MAVDRRGAEQVGRSVLDASRRLLEIMTVDFTADAVTSMTHRGQTCGSRAQERVENRIADKAEHANQAFRQFHGKRSRVVAG